MTLAVVDTNIVVAGLLTADPGAPVARILDGMLDSRFAFAVSVELMAEYRAVLLRPRIRERHGLVEGEIDRLLAALALNARVVEPPPAPVPAPDPGDDHLWALLAATGDDAVLVTGDRLLQRHAPPGRAAVDSASAFLERIERRP